MAAGFGSVGEFVHSDLKTELEMIAVNVSAVKRWRTCSPGDWSPADAAASSCSVPSWAGTALPSR